MTKKLFSTAWKSSTQTKKQRKYKYNAPLHIKSRFLNCNLSKELKTEHSTRNLRVRKADVVKIITGQFKNKIGKVDKVSIIKGKVFVENMTIKKKDGSSVLYPINPSNLQIIKLDLSDKRRVSKLKKLKELNGGKK